MTVMKSEGTGILKAPAFVGELALEGAIDLSQDSMKLIRPHSREEISNKNYRW